MTIIYRTVPRRRGMGYPELKRDHLGARPQPLILTDLTSDWPALECWTPTFFKKHYGQCTLDWYDASFQQPGNNYLQPAGQVAFGDYLDEILAGPTDRRLFLFQLFRMAPELRRDVVLPPWVDQLSRQFLVTFFGGAGGVTTLHYDVDLPHVFHAVLYGQKEFYLFDPNRNTDCIATL